MNTLTRFAAALLLATVLVAGPAISHTFAASASLRVHATIKPYLQFSASQAVHSYQVTAADIQAGHIDLPRALSLQYRTNIPETIRFEIASSGPEQVEVNGRLGAIQVAEALPGQRVARNLDLRILLPAQTKEGIYPLELALAPVAY